MWSKLSEFINRLSIIKYIKVCFNSQRTNSEKVMARQHFLGICLLMGEEHGLNNFEQVIKFEHAFVRMSFKNRPRSDKATLSYCCLV